MLKGSWRNGSYPMAFSSAALAAESVDLESPLRRSDFAVRLMAGPYQAPH